mgnify:CR=1 FL=1
MNHEGYTDPTAEQAIRNYNRLTHKEKDALYHLKQIASLLGFEIICVKDKRTGKEYTC